MIEQAHKFREKLLNAIQSAEIGTMAKFHQEVIQGFGKDSLSIINRIPNNKLRAFKNILLSHNTLYSYAAEKGGLSAWQSHYLSEKYATLIEHTDHYSQLEQIHLKMLEDYSDPAIRFNDGENEFVQAANND